MKTGERPVSPRSAPGGAPEAIPGQRALGVYRGGAKILTPPGAKQAVVYVRQAALQQGLEHRASTARQSA
jgi:hypothetical protein